MPVILYDIEGLSYGEIAKVLGIAEGTVKSAHPPRAQVRCATSSEVDSAQAADQDAVL